MWKTVFLNTKINVFLFFKIIFQICFLLLKTLCLLYSSPYLLNFKMDLYPNDPGVPNK